MTAEYAKTLPPYELIPPIPLRIEQRGEIAVIDPCGGSRCDESPEFVALECVSSLCLRQTPGLGFEVPESPSCVLLLSGLRTLLLSCLIRHGDFSFFSSRAIANFRQLLGPTMVRGPV